MASSTTNVQPSQWADLLPELLGRVIAGLPFPDDLARFRAVCRPWHAAVREHFQPGLPWIIHSDGSFVTYDHAFHRRVPFPDNTRFVGAHGSWLALCRTDVDAGDGRRSYLLHNPFTKTTVPLPGLDSVIGKVSRGFQIRKVLMRSDQRDFVAVTTNSRNYPIILCRPGKPGAWWPERHETQYASIYDVAFHMGDLYGITHDRELVRLGLDVDDDGTPTVVSAGCAIDYMPDDEDEEVDYDDDEEEEDADGEDGYYEGDVLMPDPREVYEDDYHDEYITTSRCLVESNGRLLMLTRRERTQHSSDSYTLNVEVLEAYLALREWVPTDVTGILYVSDRHSEYVDALINEDEDVLSWHFADEHDEMDPESKTPDETIRSMSTWFFPQELVV